MSSKHVNRIFSILILNEHFLIVNFPIFINSSTINARIFYYLDFNLQVLVLNCFLK